MSVIIGIIIAIVIYFGVFWICIIKATHILTKCSTLDEDDDLDFKEALREWGAEIFKVRRYRFLLLLTFPWVLVPAARKVKFNRQISGRHPLKMN